MSFAWLAHVLVGIVHVLASAAWFGAMFYSVTVLQPRSKAYFKSDEELEEFTATIAHGARAKVLAALVLIGLSGVLLVLIARPQETSTRWMVLICIKAALLVIAAIIFSVASWRLWPRRIFAIGDELGRVRRQFLIVQVTLLSIAAVAIALGVAAH